MRTIDAPGSFKRDNQQTRQEYYGYSLKMSIETKSMHFTPVGGNVFVDLGFEPEEAAALKAESQRIISEKLATKDSLMTELAGWIGSNRQRRSLKRS